MSKQQEVRPSRQLLLLSESIEQKIFFIRDERVMIDRDLAELYGVETKYLNRQVRRNRDRFPEEFMFQLTSREKEELVTNWHLLCINYLPHVPAGFETILHRLGRQI